MGWFVVYVNGRPFGVTAASAEDAIEIATVHLAAIIGRKPQSIDRIERLA